MSYIIEVFYRGPVDSRREELISSEALRFGGQLDFRESSGTNSKGLCLTFEFNDNKSDERAAEGIRELGKHVAGPAEYG